MTLMEENLEKTIKAWNHFQAFPLYLCTLLKQDSRSGHFTPFEVRIGINTGPVVAGVVGTKKFAFDIWGDAVNKASRKESNSTPGRINISEDTFHLIKDQYQCEYRGEIDVKNRGHLKMYYVVAKPEMLDTE